MNKRNLESTEKKKALMLGALELNYGNVRKSAKMTKINGNVIDTGRIKVINNCRKH